MGLSLFDLLAGVLVDWLVIVAWFLHVAICLGFDALSVLRNPNFLGFRISAMIVVMFDLEVNSL